MKKYYCDVCEKEITKENAQSDVQVWTKNGELELGLSVGIFDAKSLCKKAEDTIVCQHCIIDTFNRNDNRTKPTNKT